MKKFLSLITCCAIFSAPSFAGITVSKNKDISAIKKMTGCYQVIFQSSETFAYQKDYEYYPKYRSGALEWIFVDSETENMQNIQHLLITDMGIVKHWRQKWEYQANQVLSFEGFNNWQLKDVLKTSGSWVQRVYQVDDSPRYECSAPWIHTENKTYWECEANAPLPRREFSVRSDYNILFRNNRHEITNYGHLHDQDNIKIKRDENFVDTKIAMEKSYNTYKKVEDEKCQAAVTWWQDHKEYWRDVQFVFDSIIYSRKQVQFKKKVNGQLLWEALFILDDELSTSDYSSSNGISKIKGVVESYLE